MKQTAKVVPMNTMSRDKWRARITDAWNKQIIDIFEVGNLLDAAKEELVHGEWGVLVKDELPFDRMTAHRLIGIATDEKLRDVTHVLHLPAHWGTLYELTKLTAEQFDAAIESGAIHPKMKRRDVSAIRGIEPKKKEPTDSEKSPSNLSAWKSDFNTRITNAAFGLSQADRAELFDYLRHIMTVTQRDLDAKMEQ